MNADMKRRLARRWVRGLSTIGIVLLLPVVFPRLVRGIQQQTTIRVTPTSTEVVESKDAEEQESSNLRGLVWWSRIIAVVIALGMITGTVDTIREARSKPQ